MIFLSFYKKIIVFLLIVAMITPAALGLFLPKPVKAVWGFGDTVIGIGPHEVAQSTHVAFVRLKDILRIAWNTVIKPMLIKKITNDIIKWIQGEGEPKFVGNWNQFLKDAADEAGLILFNELTDINWCNVDWGLQLQLSLKGPKPFNVKCSLSDVYDDIKSEAGIDVTVNDFYEDFSKGGWKMWSAAAQPQNNFVGNYFATYRENQARRAAAANDAEKDALAGGGFTSDRICAVKDYNTCLIWKDEAQTECGLYACKKYVTITPSKTIADITSKVVGIDIDWLVNSFDDSEFSKSLAAIINAIISRVMREGLANMETDEYEGESESDTFPPIVLITSPRESSRPEDFRCDYDVTAEVYDDTSVVKVDFYANDDLFLTTTTPPYTAHWSGADLNMARNSLVAFMVIAYDEAGNSGNDTLTTGLKCEVSIVLPVAIITGGDTYYDQDRSGSETIVLDGSSSYDLDGEIVSYSWSGACSGSTEDISCTLTLGSHEVTLTVTDNEGLTDSDTTVVVIADVQENEENND